MRDEEPELLPHPRQAALRLRRRTQERPIVIRPKIRRQETQHPKQHDQYRNLEINESKDHCYVA
jgi:hypothetical protein